MRFSVGRQTFAEAVGWAARGLSSRPSVPVLAGARLEVCDGRLTVTGTDADVAAGIALDVDRAVDGVALVHGRLLADIVRVLPDHPVEVTVAGSELEVTCGAAGFALPVMPVEEHPGTPPLPAAAGTVAASAFAAAVAQVTGSAAREDAVPVLTAVRCAFSGTSITLLATDRYRLAERVLAWQPLDAAIALEALVPARTLAGVAKAYAALGGPITLAVGAGPHPGTTGGLLGVCGPDRWLTTRLFDDGQYPAVQRLLDAARPLHIRVAVADLLDAVRRVALVADAHTPVTLTFTGGRVRVEARGAYQARAHDEVAADHDGAPVTMAFNAPYLLDGLLALASPVALFRLADGVKPPLLTGATDDGSAATDDVRYLVQPLRARP